MKFVKKALTLLMATSMTTSLFLTACKDNGGENPAPSSTDYLLKGGVSSYKIVLPNDADSDELLAGERLQSIQGSVPSPQEIPKGCRFSPRCPYATEKCLKQAPDLVKVEDGHHVRCFYAEKEGRCGEEHKRLIVRG